MTSSPHAPVVSWPGQGHITPLTHLSYFLLNHGFQITFVVIESKLSHVSVETGVDSGQIRIISVPDKLNIEEVRKDMSKLLDTMEKEIPLLLEEVIGKNSGGEDEITCMIADASVAWALEVGRKMGLRTVAFMPAPAALLATIISIPELIEDGVIGTDGQPKHEEMKFQVTPNMPPIDATHFIWNYGIDGKPQEALFRYMTRNGKDVVKYADFILCNSSQDLEPNIFVNFLNMLLIGPLPLHQAQQTGTPIGRIWPEDNTCTAWLEQQQANSVMYIAFGTMAIINQNQLEELALGFENSNKPFLWVIRPDLIDTGSDRFWNQFQERVKGRGKIVRWCDQAKVLAHPSIACFVTHCGWNSTLDGVKNGVPFLCCPFLADQFMNQRYICDVWKIGLRLVEKENMTITKERVHSRLVELLADDEIRKRAEKLKEMVKRSISEGGSSFMNLSWFVDSIKK